MKSAWIQDSGRAARAPDGGGPVAPIMDRTPRGVPRSNLVLGQLRTRNLPVPAAVFAKRLARVLEGLHGESRNVTSAR